MSAADPRAETVISLRRAGRTIREIVQAVHMDHRGVCAIVRAAGLPITRGGAPQYKIDRSEVRRLLAEGLTHAEIARRLGVFGRSTIYRIVNSMKPEPVAIPGPVAPRSPPTVPTAEGSRPSLGDYVVPPRSRNLFEGRGCTECGNLWGCSCGAPVRERRLSPAEMAATPVRTDARLADEAVRGDFKAGFGGAHEAHRRRRARMLDAGLQMQGVEVEHG